MSANHPTEPVPTGVANGAYGANPAIRFGSSLGVNGWSKAEVPTDRLNRRDDLPVIRRLLGV